jgi:hypothetical protein
MTYLEIVNSVLKRLREESVTSVDETDYSSLIGTFVNDALILVEDAWQWTNLREGVSVSTVDGTRTYTLDNITSRSEVLSVVDTSNNRFLRFKPWNDFKRLITQDNVPEGDPQYFSFNGPATAGGEYMAIQFYPTPNNIRTIDVDVIKRSPTLSNESDVVSVPSNPVIQLAFAMAIQERGEVQGLSSTQQFAIGQRALQDAIALDSQWHNADLDWNNGYDWSRR